MGRRPHLGKLEKWDSLSPPGGDNCKINGTVKFLEWGLGMPPNWAELAQYLEMPFKPSVAPGTELQPLALLG